MSTEPEPEPANDKSRRALMSRIRERACQLYAVETEWVVVE